MKNIDISDISEQGDVLTEEQLREAAGGIKDVYGPTTRDPNDATTTGTHDYYRGVSRIDGDCEVGPCIGPR